MGGRLWARRNDTLCPLVVKGGGLSAFRGKPEVASAQVKSSIILAALAAGVEVELEELGYTRDHTENMLRGLGVPIGTDDLKVHLPAGPHRFEGFEFTVPGDPSSAAFFAVAASVVPGSDLVIENVGLNPTRSGIFTVLEQMGATIEKLDERDVGGEPVADLRVRHAALKGIDVDPAIAPSMIDEFPILFVAAAMASGTTVTSGLDELRVKESDRLSAMAAALSASGVNVEERDDGLVIEGSGGLPLRGTANAKVETHLDHRIAMSMAVAGLASRDGVEIDDIEPIATSFPNFTALLDEASA